MGGNVKRDGRTADDFRVLVTDPGVCEPMTSGPTVSVILPTRDEAANIRDCLDALIAQDYPNVLEILVVDGDSADRTRAIALRVGGRVRVVDNPAVTAAAAMNLGLQSARGEIVVRADAHTVYATDYIRRCVDLLADPTVTVAGGPMRPVGIGGFGRAVAAVTSSRAGIGPGAFHYATERQDVDTVYLGAYRQIEIDALGGYDTDHLQWAAEDHELNFRVRQAGGRVVVDPAIRSYYFPRETPGSLWRQYRNYGVGKVSTLVKHRRLPTWRPLAPAALVAGTVAVAGIAIALRRPALATAPLAAYGLGAGVVALRLGADPGVAPHRAFGALVICHWAYGCGFWSGARRVVTRRPFDRRPRGARV